LASKLDTDIGQHHWPPPLPSTINTAGQQHLPPQLVSTTGRHLWPGPFAKCSKYVDDADDDDDNMITTMMLMMMMVMMMVMMAIAMVP
jgi:hypothetical protein